MKKEQHHWTYGHRRRPEYNMWRNAKRRAEKYGLPFTIERDDITIPSRCPVLGIELRHDYNGQKGSSIANSPSLDRIIPELGYTPDNILVVSRLANNIKSNATIDQIGAVFAYYQARLIQLSIDEATQ